MKVKSLSNSVQQLGPTIENIAWHKAGIFKPGAIAISATQDPAAADVLISRAVENATTVQFVDNDEFLPVDTPQLLPSVQRINCSVALAIVRRFLETTGGHESSDISRSDVLEGLKQFSWPGRFQLVVENGCRWFLDSEYDNEPRSHL
jgi:folylpolyglutamate synthase